MREGDKEFTHYILRSIHLIEENKTLTKLKEKDLSSWLTHYSKSVVLTNYLKVVLRTAKITGEMELYNVIKGLRPYYNTPELNTECLKVLTIIKINYNKIKIKTNLI